jgi:hypothetical protein
MNPAKSIERESAAKKARSALATRDVLQDILSRARISEVYSALTGATPRRAGRDTWRGPALWRGGNSPDSVSLNDARGVWHDFVANQGGGVLDLVICVRGGSKHEALKWLADFAGVPLEASPISQEQRERWVQERQVFARDLVSARYWQRSMIGILDELLDSLKNRFFNPEPGQERPPASELQNATAFLSRLQSRADSAIVDEFRWWRECRPNVAAALVQIARKRERTDWRAAGRYLAMTSTQRSHA